MNDVMAQADSHHSPNASSGAAGGNIVNAMSIDIEDYFQVQALESHFDRATWNDLETRVERNTEQVLQLFADAGVKATFFTLGWIAERHKNLIRRIVAEGHELASHGYSHIRADQQSPAEFREDISKTKSILEDIAGVQLTGYRAATFSIGAKNLWAFEVLAEEGYRYSSSIFPVKHDYYGMPDAPRFPYHPISGQNFKEFPISTVSFWGRNVPCGGGGYFRILPYWFSRFAVNQINQTEGRPFVFYFHPWEVDPDQPRPDGVSIKSRFRHYTNLNRMERRLRRLLNDFRWDRIDNVLGRDNALGSSGSRP